MTDPIFGELAFDFAWTGEKTVKFCGQDYDIALVVYGDETGGFEDGQYDAYRAFLEKWDTLQPELLEAILRYYSQRREELGGDDDYPEIKDTETLLGSIRLVGVVVPYADTFGGRSMGVTFDCDWDEENGIGIALSDEKVVEVGGQDVVM